MVKVNFPNTWGYENFITDEEKDILLQWMNQNFGRTYNNGDGRFYFPHAQNLENIPETYNTVKQRIIEVEQLNNFRTDPNYGDFISFNLEGASIHPHTDSNERGRIHTRYNLLVSMPESGGQPVYGNNILEVKEKMLWRCVAGAVQHKSLPVVGSKPRLNISFGFSIEV